MIMTILERITRPLPSLMLAGLLVLTILAGGEWGRADAAATPEELREQIRLQTERLESINRDLEEAQKDLEVVQGQRVSLQRELGTIDSSITRLDLNIRSGEATTKKLELELDSLQYDLRSISLSMEDKKKVVADLLRELQRKDDVNLLVLLMRHESLAESLSEARSIGNVRSQLEVDISNLATLSGIYDEKLDSVSAKKSQVELEQRNLLNRKVILEDQKGERQVILTETRNQESVYQRKVEELEAQQYAISDEISKFEDELRRSFDAGLLPIERPGVFAWPLANVRITQNFGEVSRLYRGKPHNGIDLGTPVGTPVFASEAGEVMAVGNNDRDSWRKYQYGRYIVIRHDNNLATLYAHLSRQVVSEGQAVARGDLIGYTGNTGYVTGPHLHFGLYWAPSIVMKSIPPAAGLVPVGVTIDPAKYL